MNFSFRSPCMLLFIFMLVYFIIFLIPALINKPGPLIDVDYPQGYFIKSVNTGPMRVIPLGGNNIKSPTANDPKAVFSPFGKDRQDSATAIQKSRTY